MLFARVAQLAAIGAALFCGSQANAGPTIYGTYYDETAANLSCTTNCTVNFSQLPSDKLLLVRKLNCFMSSQGRPVQAQFFVSDGTGPMPRHFSIPLPASPAPASNGFYYTTVDMDPEWLIGPGRFPYVSVSALPSGTLTVDCTLRGDLYLPIQ
ncbi:hypothetical protein [Bradyrhizobium sp.]|jgi:hypothetical protein|uniref:hypothetical protein n=1 Tax=Bradyrhizobium sp. TaxID=376 RepID=UPI002DDD92D8|nr:hypothetical protein [Bradyrhizobium sp.]HEV2156318.1 hypothetical protein [Bradyrhizobium sp.]